LETRQYWAISFGGGSSNYHDAVTRVSNELSNINIFDKIIEYTDNDLYSDLDFWEMNGEFIEQNKRGYGYWLWKPYLIYKTMEQMNDDDILLYLDSGCEVINSKDSYIHVQQMMNDCNKYKILYTLTGHNELTHTKMDLFKYFGLDNENIFKSEQIQATIIFIKKSKETVNFIKDWYNLSCNYHLIDDSISKEENNREFKDHRHDQSIFSLLLKTDKYKNDMNTDNNIIKNTYPFSLSRKRRG
jgi:hypothetical protein